VSICAECVEHFHDRLQTEEHRPVQLKRYRSFIDHLVEAARQEVPRLLAEQQGSAAGLPGPLGATLEGLTADGKAILRQAIACAAELGIAVTLRRVHLDRLALVHDDGLKLVPVGTTYGDFADRLLGKDWKDLGDAG
jgi:hypothetical protein